MSRVKLTPYRNHKYSCPKCLAHKGMKADGNSAFSYFVCNICESAMDHAPMTEEEIQERKERREARKAERKQARDLAKEIEILNCGSNVNVDDIVTDPIAGNII